LLSCYKCINIEQSDGIAAKEPANINGRNSCREEFEKDRLFEKYYEVQCVIAGICNLTASLTS